MLINIYTSDAVILIIMQYRIHLFSQHQITVTCHKQSTDDFFV